MSSETHSETPYPTGVEGVCGASLSGARPAHEALRVLLVDGWIQVVDCSCSTTSRPTTHEWASNHFNGTFDEGWQVLVELVNAQATR